MQTLPEDRPVRLIPCLCAGLLLSQPVPAAASSDDAWAAFRDSVRSACLALVAPGTTPEIEVNPFGSDSYGAANVTVATAAGTDRMICIFDKRTGRAELTAPFAP